MSEISAFLQCMPHSIQARWYIGDIATGGLCNMLFGIYSLIPIAMFLNSSLIMGHMSTRKSYEVDYDKYLHDPVPLPFSRFFDWDHFESHWRDRNLSVARKESTDHCLSLIEPATFKRKEWFAQKESRLLHYLHEAHIPVPIPPEPKYELMKVKFPLNNLAFYDYWQNDAGTSLLEANDVGRHTDLLLEVHESLRPSKQVMRHFHHHRLRLPKTYWVLHLRVEGDVYRHEPPDDKEFLKVLPVIIEDIRQSACYRNFTASATSGSPPSLPALYLATGAFSHPSSFLWQRGQLTVQELRRQLGFSEVYWKNVTTAAASSHGHASSLQHRRLRRRLEQEEDAEAMLNVTAGSAPQDDKLSLELHSLVDLHLARHAECFIPAYNMGSSFSYMALRFRQMDRAIASGERLRGRDRDALGYHARTVEIFTDFPTWGF